MPEADQRARSAAWAALLLLLPGCTVGIGRGPVTDFFVKDYDLPDYAPGVAAFRAERQRLEPTPETGALGGMAGAYAGGRRRAWRAQAAGGLGGLAGALVAQEFSQAETEPPLPAEYGSLSLALPIVVTDPNKGPTFGLLPVSVLQEGNRITNIFAPDFTYNEIDGIGSVFRMLRFFSRDSFLKIDAGSSTEGYNQFKVHYEQRRLGPNRFLYFRGLFRYDTDLSQRFYGLGNDTDEDAESTYVFRKTQAGATIGLELPLDVSIELRERVVSYGVGPGRLEDVASTKARHPDVFGVNDGRLTVLTHQIRLTYDGRDSADNPTEGVFGQFTYDVADNTLGGSVGFNRFRLELVAHLPLWRKRFITVFRVAAWLMTGEDIPFYELTSVGGRSTVRGYGEGRFVDKNGFVANVEERIRLYELVLAGNRIQVQVAAFLDVGRVYAGGEGFTLRDSKFAVGGALRILVPDSNLVTSIDMGFSDEGSAVFVDLGYPF